MRTDLMRSRTALAMLALATLAAPLAAQAPPPRPAAPAPPAPPGDRVAVFGGDRVVAKGETVDGDVVVVGSDLRVLGTIRGDAVVAGGDLILEPGAAILGDAVVTGGELIDRGGRVRGEMRTVTGAPGARRASSAPSAPLAAAARVEHSWFTPIAEGLAGLLGTLAFALVLAGAGAALVFYALPQLRTVSETVRVSTARSAAVGFAAIFLIVPAFVALVVLLAVSLVGIPLLLVAVPLYPLAVVAALGFGLLAVAHLIGERTAERRSDVFGRHRHAYAYVFAGIALLFAPLLAGNLLTIAGMEVLSTLLMIAVATGLWAAATVGLGAVVLSRAGTRDTFAHPPYTPPADPDPFWDAEPLVEEPRV